MKRIVLLSIASMMTFGMLTGCSGQSDSTPPSTVSAVEDAPTTTMTGKISVNFEGRVSKVEAGRITLDTGKVVLISEQTEIKDPQGQATEISVGDYIQGYATDPESAELDAQNILITVL